jgi:NADH-quinone oxidoreductase subunit F
LEAVSIGAFAVGAEVAIIYLGHLFLREELQLSKALGEAKEAGYLGGAAGGPDIFIYRSPGGYISGEETAIFELIEGRPGRPRGKPPVPTREGILGSPTVVNNLETLLHALFIIEHGPDRFREAGTPNCPGTLLFSLSGQVERPGLYELGLGTSLRQLVLVHGGGGLRGRPLRAVLPGGLSSRLFGPESLDIDLDYDSMRDAGADLGAGAVIVVTAEADVAALTLQLARFYHENSCGKCQPCKDGTGRTLRMLERLEYLDQTSIDIIDRPRPPSSRSRGLVVLDERGNEPGGISYTDTVKGLSKIKHLCDWYEFRGDCHHSAEAARAIRSAIDLFESDLNA